MRQFPLEKEIFMKKTKLILSALIALSILAGTVLTACADPEYTVVYEITGQPIVAASVIYYNETGGMVHLTDVNIPWSHTMTVSGKNINLSCSATILSGKGTYIAKIYVNGTEKTYSSSNSYPIAIYVIK